MGRRARQAWPNQASQLRDCADRQSGVNSLGHRGRIPVGVKGGGGVDTASVSGKTPTANNSVQSPSCSRCGSEQVIAVAPGSEPEQAPGGILVARGALERRWCARCWREAFVREVAA
jgi:hypothetical protein